jgi:tRNA(fMet)-specific endonuclease VapC
MDYILDTNICIYIIKKKPQSVFDRLKKISDTKIFISSITVAELEYGVRKSASPERNQTALTNFLAPFTIVNFDSKAAFDYGIIRNDLEKRGLPIGSLDLLIGAQAKSLNLILVTNNEGEFRRIHDLKVENWF